MKLLLRTACLLLLLAATANAECIPFTDAPKKVGATTCVKGKVVNVGVGRTGTHYLNFCEDYRDCPFNVVIFPSDLKHVGDVRWLEGKEIEIEGTIREYKGRPEIILKDVRQLRGQAANLPKLPKDYDVEHRGSYSSGRYANPHPKREKAAQPK